MERLRKKETLRRMVMKMDALRKMMDTLRGKMMRRRKMMMTKMDLGQEMG